MSRRKLSDQEIAEELKKLNGWRLEGKKIAKRFEFKNFADSLEFVNSAGALAEEADHHPDIHFGWGYAEFEITTHDTGGLTENDFNLAVKIDEI